MNVVNDKRMQVSTDPSFFVRMSGWMGFLLDALRYRGITRASLAGQYGVAGCNVSAFISSKGQLRNIREEKLLRMLVEVGLNPDGTVTPGVHRWNIPGDPPKKGVDHRDVLGDLLRLNPPLDPARPPRCLRWEGSDVGFLVHRVARVSVLLVRVPLAQVERQLSHKKLKVVVETITAGEASELHTLWAADDPDWVVSRAIDTYLDQTQAPLQKAAAPMITGSIQ